MSDGRLPRQRPWVKWTVGSVITVLVLSLGWVAIRGVGAVLELQHVAEEADVLKAEIGAGDLDGAARAADRAGNHAETARALTADPIWRTFEVLPLIGPNFTGVRQVAEIADDVATDALSPVLEVAQGVDLAALGFSAGAVDLTPFAAVQAPLGEASVVLKDAEARALHIDDDATLPALGTAVRQIRGVLTQAANLVGTLHGASVLLPSMLGGEGPRHYIVAMQNNAELRSSGGIVGAFALVRAEGGRLEVVRQASTVDFPPLPAPVPLSESTVALFDDGPGRHIQNLTSVPDFAEAAPVLATRWQNRFGDTIDGVVAVDTLVAEHVLAATGPIEFAGMSATKDDIVRILLSDIYAMIPDPVAQDAVFASAATSLFAAALGSQDTKALFSAIAAAGEDDRIRVWSAHPSEQEVLAASTLGGGIPRDTPDASHVGVLINDKTGGKMNFYTDAKISTSQGRCSDQELTELQVTWHNNAPQDAATALPSYVTAGGHYGVDPGSISTVIALYGPEGSELVSSNAPDALSTQTTLLHGRPVIQFEVLLTPGAETTLAVRFANDEPRAPLVLEHTPLVESPDVVRTVLNCE